MDPSKEEELKQKLKAREDAIRFVEAALSNPGPMAQTAEHAPVAQTAEQWWFSEAWTKLRPFVIEFSVEAASFALFLLSLEAFHRIVDRTSLSEDERHLLHKFHFYSHFVALGIFGISFIIQVLFRRYGELFKDREP